MADDDEFSKNRNGQNREEPIDSDNSDVEPIKLDLGIDRTLRFERMGSLDGAAGSNINDTPKREENPFSFKHFLRSDINNYNHQGARPKVYCDGRPISSVSDLDLQRSTTTKQTRIISEFSAGLPDFVQDHLVVEQCYSNDNSSQNNYNVDVNNLPDFAPLGHCSHVNGETSRNSGRRTDSPSNLVIPLDLPIRTVGFPLDLPVADTQPPAPRSCPTSSEVGVSKSLPDFLTDGAVRTQANDDNQVVQNSVSEMERLRHDCDMYREQLVGQNRRVDQLQAQLEASRNKEHEYTKNLVKALEHVEENLEKSNQRAASAENIITKLRQEIRSLKNEITRLREENGNLRSQHSSTTSRPTTSASACADTQSQRLSQELRASANTAENSLRQLLAGVDNLRMIAATIENMNRIEEKTDTYSDLEDDSGPAL